MEDVFRSISRIFRDADASPEARRAVVFAAWKRAAGVQVESHAVPVNFENKRLTIAVADESWRRQMENLGPQMVFRLNGAFGASFLNFIEFIVDESAFVGADNHAESKDESKYFGQLAPELIEAAASIGDAKLRALFLAAAGACIERPTKLGKHF